MLEILQVQVEELLKVCLQLVPVFLKGMDG